MTRPDREDRRVAEDRGSVSVLMCFIVVIAVALAAFLVEAGTSIQANTRADIDASEAARAAMAAAGPTPGDDATARAAAAARAYLAAAGAGGVVTVLRPGRVAIDVTVIVDSPLLGRSVSGTAHHTAQLLLGATTGEGP